MIAAERSNTRRSQGTGGMRYWKCFRALSEISPSIISTVLDKAREQAKWRESDYSPVIESKRLSTINMLRKAERSRKIKIFLSPEQSQEALELPSYLAVSDTPHFKWSLAVSYRRISALLHFNLDPLHFTELYRPCVTGEGSDGMKRPSSISNPLIFTHSLTLSNLRNSRQNREIRLFPLNR